MARVTIVIVTWESERFVDGCFGALARAPLAGAGAEVVVVDNASRDGTVQAIATRYPWVTVVRNEANLGFAGGNDVGMRLALERGAEWIYLLNPDTEVAPSFLDEALEVARANPGAGAVQSLLLLGGSPDRINTAGNAIHFLGFGHCRLLGAPIDAAPRDAVEIPFASGAAVLLSARALREVGLFDEFLFLYHEDLDLGWRLRLAGYGSVLAPRSRVRHHYEFSRNRRKYFFLERNRWVVLLKNLSVQSLVVLAPALLAAEAGLLLVAAVSGWLPEKLRAWAELLRPSTWRHVIAARRATQATRRVSDLALSRHFAATIDFPGLPGGWVAALVAAPMRLAWWLLHPLMGRRSSPRA